MGSCTPHNQDAADEIQANAAYLLAQSCPTGLHVGSVHAHMETCPGSPYLPTPEQTSVWLDAIERWKNAPSNTASADIPKGGSDG